MKKIKKIYENILFNIAFYLLSKSSFVYMETRGNMFLVFCKRSYKISKKDLNRIFKRVQSYCYNEAK